MGLKQLFFLANVGLVPFVAALAGLFTLIAFCIAGNMIYTKYQEAQESKYIIENAAITIDITELPPQASKVNPLIVSKLMEDSSIICSKGIRYAQVMEIIKEEDDLDLNEIDLAESTVLRMDSRGTVYD